jgi:hypothetical protein
LLALGGKTSLKYDKMDARLSNDVFTTFYKTYFTFREENTLSLILTEIQTITIQLQIFDKTIELIHDNDERYRHNDLNYDFIVKELFSALKEASPKDIFYTTLKKTFT